LCLLKRRCDADHCRELHPVRWPVDDLAVAGSGAEAVSEAEAGTVSEA
jgi:hypothetical protein